MYILAAWDDAVTVGRIIQPLRRHIRLRGELITHYERNERFTGDRFNLVSRYDRLLLSLLGDMHNHPGDLACWAIEAPFGDEPSCIICGDPTHHWTMLSIDEPSEDVEPRLEDIEDQLPVHRPALPAAEEGLVCFVSRAGAPGKLVWHHPNGPSRAPVNTLSLCKACHLPIVTGRVFDAVEFHGLARDAPRRRGLPSFPPEAEQGPDRRLRRYRNEVIGLCKQWGLDCLWAPTWIHRLNMGSVSAGNEYGQWASPAHASNVPRPVVRIEVEYDPSSDPPKDVEKRMLAQWREQREQIRRDYLKRGYICQDAEPEIDRHMRWLYLRICSHEGADHGWGWHRIAKVESVSPSTVRNAVLALADEMGIVLSNLPPGRPRVNRQSH